MKLGIYGFSLIELMVGGVILAGIGLTGAQLMKGAKVTQSRIDHDLELDLIHSKITSMFMENAKDCDATFRHLYGTGLTTAITQIKTCPISLAGCTDYHLDASSVPISNPNVPFTTGPTGPELSPRSLWYIQSFGVPVPHNNQAAARTNLMILPVNYAHKTLTNRRVTKFTTIAMRFNSAGAFLQCLDGKSQNIQNIAKEVCTFIRRQWNGETNTCVMGGASSCALGTVFRGISATGPICESTNSIMSNSVPGIGDYIMDTLQPCPQSLSVALSPADGNKVTVICF